MKKTDTDVDERSSVIHYTPQSIRTVQERGGSTFDGQVENIIKTQVGGLPDGSTFTVGTVPGGTAPLISFTKCPANSMLTLNSVNGSAVIVGLKAAAAAISFLAANWLIWYHEYAGDDVAENAAYIDWKALGRYIYRSGCLKGSDIAAIARYTD